MKKKTNKEKEKEKKILQLMQYDSKHIYDKDAANNIHKASKSNQELIAIDANRKLSLNAKEPTIKRRNVKTLSIHITKSPEKYQTIINNPDEILKTKIFRVVGKKINNFSQTFEEKSNSLNDLFQKCKTKISEIRTQFNYYSNSTELSTNKLKNNPIKFINFNEVIIFERKVIEYLEKRIFFYMKLINNIESIISEDNINFNALNAFYSSIEKENTIIINNKSNECSVNNDKDNISSHKSIKDVSIGNLYSSNNKYEKYNDLISNGNNQNTNDQNILNTERNNRIDNKYNKLFLPSLKAISHNHNQLNRSTFRNSQLKLNSLSKDKQKNYDIFNVQKPSLLESMKKNKDEHILALKDSKKSVDKQKVLIEHKHKEPTHIPYKGDKKVSKKSVKIVEHDKDNKKDKQRKKENQLQF